MHPETTEKIFRLGYDVAAAAITCASLGLGKTMTICRSIVILGLSLWALFAPALTSAQGIPRCQPGTALQCTSEGGGPPTCQCVAIPAWVIGSRKLTLWVNSVAFAMSAICQLYSQ
jgi:hypothetical protein